MRSRTYTQAALQGYAFYMPLKRFAFILGPWTNINPQRDLPRQGARTDLATVASKIKDGATLKRVADEHPEEFIKFFRGINAYKATMTEPFRAENVRGIWIRGEPGIGKTHRVHELYPEVFVKQQNKWWDGYDGQKEVLLDDFDRQGKCLGHYIKIWADKYKATGEVKGATTNLRYEKFIITSNYSIEQIWDDDEVLQEAIRRRFQVHHVLNREALNTLQF